MNAYPHDAPEQTPRDRFGFSLAEVIISLAVLGILFAAAFGAVYQAMLINHNSSLRNQANEAVEREIEHLRSLDWSDLTALSTSAPFAQTPPDARLTTLRTITIDPNKPGLAFVKVLVTWGDNSGRTHSVSIITQYTQGGLSA